MRKKQTDSRKYFCIRITGLAASCAFLCAALFFQTRILPGVHVGVIGVGGLTRQEAIDRVTTALSEPRLTLVADGRTWIVSAEELGATCDVASAIDAAFAVGRRSGLTDGFYRTLARSPIVASCAWSDVTLTERLTTLAAAIGAPPQNATLVYQDGAFVIVPDRDGIAFDVTAFEEAVTDAVSSAKVVTVHLEPSVVSGNIRADDLVGPKQTAEAMLARELTLTARNSRFNVTRDQLGQWIVVRALATSGTNTVASLAPVPVGAKVAVDLDESAMLSYLETLADELATAPQAQETLVSINKVEVLRDGVPGSQLAVGEALADLVQAVEDGIAGTVELPMIEVPFPVEYAIPPSAPITTGKVIAVDLTKQMEYDYEDGVLVYSSKISSGINNWTPTGTFKVLGKTKLQKMSGPGYYVPNVPNILWFKAGGYSLHGVYWHNDFGIRPRSHGCVGEPLTEAEWIYNWAEVGTPVVIYKS